jgi:hypothetical protein
MLKTYEITWRYAEQYGYQNHQIFTCEETSEAKAKAYFREKEGFNGKKIMKVRTFQYDHRY